MRSLQAQVLTISVKSKEGKGTEFFVVLDCKLSNNVVKYEPIPQLQGARALVAVDDTNTCMNVSKMLKQIGMRSDWTVSGKEAIVRAKEAYDEGDEFKAYIIDWLMPKMNGFMATREIRTLSVNRKANIPIIAMTANAFEEDKQNALMSGMNGFIANPINIDVLMRTLADILKYQRKE